VLALSVVTDASGTLNVVYRMPVSSRLAFGVPRGIVRLWELLNKCFTSRVWQFKFVLGPAQYGRSTAEVVS